MRQAPWFLTLLACLGCQGHLTIGTAEMEVTTDRTEYVAELIVEDDTYREYQFTVGVRLQNTGTGTTLLQLCYPQDRIPMYGVVRSGEVGLGGSAFNPNWACVGHEESIRIEPGESRSFTYIVRGPTAWDGQTGEIHGALEGVMQLAFPIGCTLGAGCRTNVYSNPFEVTLGGSPISSR